MNYISTRGGMTAVRFQDAVLTGLARDGGLLLPEHIPSVADRLADWRNLAYNDLAYLTAIGNDLGYDQTFAQPVAWFAEPGDLLVTISSSGNSPNVLKAIAAAREKKIPVVTFSGLKANNASRQAGDANLFVPGWTYGLIECAHQVLLHAWLDAFMDVKGWELTSPQVLVPPVR